MAEEKKKQGRLARAQAQAQAKAKNKKKGNFFKETWSELKKVHWPTKQTVVKYTLVVLVFVAIMGILVWAVDKVFDVGVSALVDQETTSQVTTDNAATDNTATDTGAATDAGAVDNGADDQNGDTANSGDTARAEDNTTESN